MIYTLAITTYNRYELLLESFADVINDERIGEVLIVDDCSNASYWNKIAALPKFNPKIRVVRQAQNRGMQQNKADAIALSKNEWVIIFDSDNIIKPDYLDAIPDDLFRDWIYLPDFAWPNFDYRKFSGLEIDRNNVAEVINDDMGNCMLNTCNYLVHRDLYGEVYKYSTETKATDTIYMALQWLSVGYKFKVVGGMTYFHRVHPSSGFLENASYNMKKAEEIKKLILAL